MTNLYPINNGEFEMRRLTIAVLALGISLPAFAQGSVPTQPQFDALAANLGYRFTIVDNRPADCPGRR